MKKPPWSIQSVPMKALLGGCNPRDGSGECQHQSRWDEWFLSSITVLCLLIDWFWSWFIYNNLWLFHWDWFQSLKVCCSLSTCVFLHQSPCPIPIHSNPLDPGTSQNLKIHSFLSIPHTQCNTVLLPYSVWNDICLHPLSALPSSPVTVSDLDPLWILQIIRPVSSLASSSKGSPSTAPRCLRKKPLNMPSKWSRPGRWASARRPTFSPSPSGSCTKRPERGVSMLRSRSRTKLRYGNDGTLGHV